MENELKRNETCIIGLPRCDYVFSSNRSCFIAYGFKESKLETDILRNILTERNIEVFEAGSDLEPGKNSFCTKICSKIITSQFCIVLLNQDNKNGTLIPNANVNMEYGLMLGFNKYIIPFQRETHELPFNVAGLDTIKYEKTDFKTKAEKAINKAIEQTQPKSSETLPTDRIIESFLLTKNVIVAPIDDQGTKNIYDLGHQFGYYLLNDYSGLKYHYLGVFNKLTNDQIKWRINKLNLIISERFSDDVIEKRKQYGLLNETQMKAIQDIFSTLSAMIIVGSENQKKSLTEYVNKMRLKIELYSITEIQSEVEKSKYI